LLNPYQDSAARTPMFVMDFKEGWFSFWILQTVAGQF
jgi:hypothetical protein